MADKNPIRSQTSSIAPVRTRIMQRKCACGGNASSGSECEECKKKATVQRASNGLAAPATAPAIVHDVLRSPGQPLDAATRAVMEPRFGHDFSRVRVHTDSTAADSARAVSALAYTVGQDVVFGPGQYRPSSGDGQRLIAHELTHTIQQAGGTALSESRAAESRWEGEAEAASRAAVAGQEAGVARVASSGALALSRQPAPGAAPNSAPSPAPSAAPVPVVGANHNAIDGFTTGHAEISSANMAKLKIIATRVQASLKEHPDSKVLVVGHTDAQGTEADNVALGERRAEATRDALVKMGVPAEKMTTSSRGQSEPVDVSGKKDSPQNRRAEVKFEAAAPSAPPAPQKTDPGAPQPELPAPRFSVDFCTQFPDLCLKPPPQPVGPRNPNPSLPPDFWKPVPPAPKGSQPQSALDVLNKKIVDPVVRAVTKGLPKDVQDKAVDLAHAAVLKGITGGLGAALGAWGVDSKGQTAIQNAVEAALKEKGQGQNQGQGGQ